MIKKIFLMLMICFSCNNPNNVQNHLLTQNRMSYLPANSFRMGHNDSTVDTIAYPSPMVTLSKGIWIDITEVTQAQYVDLIGANPSYYQNNLQNPVENVTWFSAVLYCNKRSIKEGKDTVYLYTDLLGTKDSCGMLENLIIDYTRNGYRLPTEAEWEYACRSETTTKYHWGNDTNFALLDQYAWYNKNSNGSTRPVAMKKPNYWGLYDMCGNVAEWCNDWFNMNYADGMLIDPAGPTDGIYKILRGGSWYSDFGGIRSLVRSGWSPYERSNRYGFRCVCY